MTTDDTGIRIGPEDDTIAFLLLFENGLHSYVLARASAHAGYPSSTLLLSQQAVEFLIKAIRRLENEKPEPVHDLVRLIEETKRPIPQKVKDLVAHEPTRQFLQALSDAYLAPRYAERRLDLTLDNLRRHLDRIVSVLREAYTEKVKFQKKPKLYVPAWLRDAVLDGNAYFTVDDLTTDPLALLMPGSQ